MIIRHIPMKKMRRSSFAGLVKYLGDTQNKQERVGKITLSNCNSTEPLWAVQEVLATQAKNQRATGDKTYHLLISFPPGENPSADMLQTIEERVVSSIGFKEHQRISVVHHDTDNLHVHVAINKIHPKTFNMVEPFRAYKIFAEVAAKIEVEFNLEITNHQTRKSRSENLADDMEQHTGIESLMNWMKRHCKEKIEAAPDWATIHRVLAEHKLVMRVRANGFVFCTSDGLTVKASSVCRQFSKKNLEARLGAFVPGEAGGFATNVYRYEPLNKMVLDSELYARYLHDKAYSKALVCDKLKKLSAAKKRQIESAKKRARLKRTALKLMKIPRLNKKYLYKKISQTLLHDIQEVQKNNAKARRQLFDASPKTTWADWLKQQAEAGDEKALEALRYRNRNNHDYTLSGEGVGTVNIGQVDSITKEGTSIYKIDKAVIRDNGKEIKMTKGCSMASLKAALDMAQQRYGSCIRVNGSPLFKKVVLQMVIAHHIPITFADAAMEKERQTLITQQEKHHEPARRNHPGRSARGSHETLRAGFKNGRQRGRRGSVSPRSRIKPDPLCFKRIPPAENQNSLRNLSQLDVVQFASGSKVLLQDHAPDKLERQRDQPHHHVRRAVFGVKGGKVRG